MKIQEFTGGLVTRLRPQFLKLSQAARHINLDNATGTLKSVATKLASGILASKFAYFYIAQQEWVSSDSFRSYVEFDDILYWTDEAGTPRRYDGTTEGNIGIVPPPTISVVMDGAEEIGDSYASPVTGPTGDLPDDVLYYRVVATKLTGGTGSDLASSLAYDLSYDTVTEVRTVISKTADPLDLTPKAENSTVASDKEAGVITLPAQDQTTMWVYRWYQGNWHEVGFTDHPAATQALVVDDVYDISANTKIQDRIGVAFRGEFSYVYTYYNSLSGLESAPSPVGTGNGTDTEIQIYYAASSDPAIDQVRFYRVGENVTTFTLVDTIVNDVAGNPYGDVIHDIAGNHQLDSQGNLPPPDTLRFLTDAYAMLFGAEGSKLRFSEIGEPEFWPEEYFLQFDAPITGIAAVANGLIVLTRYRSHIVLGTGPTLFSQQPLSGDQGCIAVESIQYVSDSALWASTDGICISNGGKIEVLSRHALDKLTLDVENSAVHDQVYYIIETDGNILAYDYRFGAIFKEFTLGVEALAIGNDRLYGWTGGELHELFAGAEEEEFSYTSPRFVEGRITEAKTYKKVYIYCKGDIILNILINDTQVATKTFTGEDAHEIQVPHDKQRGEFIQFEVTGKGEVYEIEYVASRGKGHG